MASWNISTRKVHMLLNREEMAVEMVTVQWGKLREMVEETCSVQLGLGEGFSDIDGTPGA